MKIMINITYLIYISNSRYINVFVKILFNLEQEREFQRKSIQTFRLKLRDVCLMMKRHRGENVHKAE